MNLFWKMLKVHSVSIALFAMISSLYLLLIFWIFPTFADKMTAMNDIISGMPPGFIKAFGLEAGMGSLGEFLSSKYYEMIFVILLSIYSIMMTNQLIVHFVDRGSMAYLLATPYSRVKVAMIQFSVFLCGLFFIMITTTIIGLWANKTFITSENQLPTFDFVSVNVMGFLLFFVIGSFAFFMSTLFNDEKRALATASFIVFFMYVADMVSNLSDRLEWMRAFSIFSLFNAGEMLREGTGNALSYILLIMVGSLLFTAAIITFKRKDLPL